MRIPSLFEADPSLHREAVYKEAGRFFQEEILLAIGQLPAALMGERVEFSNQHDTDGSLIVGWQPQTSTSGT